MLGLEGLLVIILIILISACYYSELRIAIKTRKEIKERKKRITPVQRTGMNVSLLLSCKHDKSCCVMRGYASFGRWALKVHR